MKNIVKTNMIFRLVALLVAFHLSLTAAEAQVRFGYVSYETVLKSMPEYAEAKASVDKLKSQFEAEMKRAEDEFNTKYEAFMEGQRDFAVSIRNKRQSELQELMERNMAFKKEAQRLLKEAEEQVMKPVNEKLAAAIRKVGRERTLAFIFNTDGNTLPYVDVIQGENVTDFVRSELSK